VLESWKQRAAMRTSVVSACALRRLFTVECGTGGDCRNLRPKATTAVAAGSGGIADRQGEIAAEAQAWKDEQLALEASGEYFFSLNRYLFVVRRPA
jgi:hypothetical protein